MRGDPMYLGFAGLFFSFIVLFATVISAIFYSFGFWWGMLSILDLSGPTLFISINILQSLRGYFK